MKIRNVALLCALLVVFSQMLQADCEKQRERKRERIPADKSGRQKPGANNPNGKGQKTRGQRGSFKGKFISNEKAECTWSLNEATATLNIDCKREGKSFSCQFSGNPSSCPQYSENQKAFWKQITRSLKKQENICENQKGILKSKLCKKGPPSAHLTYVALHSDNQENLGHSEREVTQAPTKASSDCVEDEDYVDQLKVAEQYCTNEWLSLCSFFISMVQTKKC